MINWDGKIFKIYKISYRSKSISYQISNMILWLMVKVTPKCIWKHKHLEYSKHSCDPPKNNAEGIINSFGFKSITQNHGKKNSII